MTLNGTSTPQAIEGFVQNILSFNFHCMLYVTQFMLLELFFCPPMESIFLNTFYGLYFSHHNTYITNYISSWYRPSVGRYSMKIPGGFLGDLRYSFIVCLEFKKLKHLEKKNNKLSTQFSKVQTCYKAVTKDDQQSPTYLCPMLQLYCIFYTTVGLPWLIKN